MIRVTRNRLVLWLTVLGGLFLATGCGQSLPATVKVSGKVTYHGKAVPHGTVSFMPMQAAAEGQSQQPATGRIQADGSYIIQTFRIGDGVRPGEYGIAIVAPANETASVVPVKNVEYLVPKKYLSPQTSGLTITIENGSRSVVKNLDLVD